MTRLRTSNSSISQVTLLTGLPGVGKSTIIKRLIQLMPDKFSGFYTEELRKEGERNGFKVTTPDGQEAILATKDTDVDFDNCIIFGNYKVNISALHQVVIPALLKAMSSTKIVVVDEIGPMEILSDEFCRVITRIIDNPTLTVIGSIVLRPYYFADSVKKHPRVNMRIVTKDNRNEIFDSLRISVESY